MGWHKVELSTTSVLGALKWRTGEYKVSVQNDVPLPVPGLKMRRFVLIDNIDYYIIN